MNIRMHRKVDVLHVDCLLRESRFMIISSQREIRSILDAYQSLLVILLVSSIVISHIHTDINTSCILRKSNSILSDVLDPLSGLPLMRTRCIGLRRRSSFLHTESVE